MRERAGSALTAARRLASGCGVDGDTEAVVAARAAAGDDGERDGTTGRPGRSLGVRAAGSGAASRSSRAGSLWVARRGAAAVGDAAGGVAASSTPDGAGGDS